ncbi:MAG: amino acid carrier protein [Gammaproteobacteria bacterium]|jgi:AGCS family alanine or glycine:cation symporter|nr:amino acid carrier protein [Gammaproteobacteria bacterium]MDP6731864.1 amino acid carrier protein [Gammaproteobacteria bacterium]|tara:strand:- start:2796 stop:4205 length:1410 start_codon:yes stop_codon:yes gene_type:complete
MENIEAALAAFADFMWGPPLEVLLVGGGLFFMVHSRLMHFRYLGHSFDLLRGKYNKPSADVAGDITHYRALATALAGTIGLGNITGVAIAITVGGPGAVFWMWVTALVGISTKFYTASLAILYRGYDDSGKLQGGPMYVIREGLGRRWLPLAWMFAVAGMFGTLPVFQINQLVQLVRDVVAIPAGIATAEDHLGFDLSLGVVLSVLLFSIAVGKVKRVSAVAGKLVPSMVVFYLLITGFLLLSNITEIPAMLALIFTDAFSGEAVSGGVIGAVILTGVQRGVFSNEAGLGTESLAHGAARTNEPAREGLVAMLGPVIDTLIVCTCTALALLVTGVWQGDAIGVTLTSQAYEQVFPGFGAYLVLIMVLVLSTTTVLTYSYYGSKCMGFLFGSRSEKYYLWGYMALVTAGAVASLDAVISLFDGVYATMAIPTMISTIILAPKVREVARDYFRRLDGGEFAKDSAGEQRPA